MDLQHDVFRKKIKQQAKQSPFTQFLIIVDLGYDLTRLSVLNHLSTVAVE